MAEAVAFEFVCGQIEARTALDRLAARGTVRLALKQAGLDSRAVTPEQMAVVVEKLLAPQLESRGIADAASICAELASRTRGIVGGSSAETPDTILRRLSS